MAGVPTYDILRPKGGDCLVMQSKEAFSVDISNILYTVVDTHLVEIEWVPVVQWMNNTLSGSSFNYPATVKTQFVMSNNGRAAELISIPHMMKDLCIRFEQVHKAFSVQETTSPESTRVDLSVQRGVPSLLFQRRWRFKHVLSFISSFGFEGKETIVTKSAGGRIEREMSSYIDSCEFIIANNPLQTSHILREVEITPAQTIVPKGTPEMSIQRVPKSHQALITGLLV